MSAGRCPEVRLRRPLARPGVRSADASTLLPQGSAARALPPSLLVLIPAPVSFVFSVFELSFRLSWLGARPNGPLTRSATEVSTTSVPFACALVLGCSAEAASWQAGPQRVRWVPATRWQQSTSLVRGHLLEELEGHAGTGRWFPYHKGRLERRDSEDAF